MRERVIENYLCKRVAEAGGIAIKFTSSNNRGVPDRLVLLPGVIVFIEVKAPGKHPFKLQKLWLSLIKALGHKAIVIDSKPKVDTFMVWYERFVSGEGCNVTLAKKLLKTLRS